MQRFKDTLNPIDDDPCNRCGSYCFRVDGIMACENDPIDSEEYEEIDKEEAMNELDELPSFTAEQARCWKCGSTSYKGGQSNESAMANGHLIVESCTDCIPGSEAELEKAIKEAAQK